MKATLTIDSVRRFETRGGNLRYVVSDADGNEYTTFREEIGRKAAGLEGRRVQVEYHETQRGPYTNVYLDGIEPVAADTGDTGKPADAEEAAWETAVQAAPWLIGESEPHAKTPPEELYETLKPFKDKVAEDIRKDGEDNG